MNPSPHWLKSLHVSDVRGLADMAVRTTREITAVVEGVHRSIHATLGLPCGARPGRTVGITGLVYRSIDGIMGLTGAGVGASLALTEPLTRRLGHVPAPSPEREVLLGILNGVFGDRLAATGNPLALPMTVRCQGQAIDRNSSGPSGDVRGRVLVMIHGLCMTDRGWRRRKGVPHPDLGAALAAKFGYTPVYVTYNSGLAVAANGLELAEQLEVLLARWPVPVEELTLLGHSMGGLLARSAVAQGERLGHAWTRQLDNMIFLGTPHHGAPLERAGAWVDSLLHATPYTRPFTALTRGRSRGIRDLRHGDTGLVQRMSACSDDRTGGHEAADTRLACPVPGDVNVLAVAGTRSNRARVRHAGAHGRDLAGDGLVPVASALGRHPDAERDLGLPDSARVVLSGTHHMDLLDNPEVTRRVSAWLSGRWAATS